MDTHEASVVGGDEPNLRAPVASPAEVGASREDAAELPMAEQTADASLEEQSNEASAMPKGDDIGKGVSSPGKIELSPTPIDGESEDREEGENAEEVRPATNAFETPPQSPRLRDSPPPIVR